jgi:hypothetical protein
LEKALHKWEPWSESIQDARAKLNFEPALLKSEEQAERWEREIGWDKAVELCVEGLTRMRLPWYFGLYWIACFCSDYRKGHSVDLSQIKVPPQSASEAWEQRVREQFVKDRGILIVYHQRGPGGKLYPPHPFLLETSLLLSLRRREKRPESEAYGTIEVKKGGELHRVSGIFDIDKDGHVKLDENGRITRNVLGIRVPANTYVIIFFGEKHSMPPKFTVEFPMFLATQDVVSMAFEQIQFYREGLRHYVPHPLLEHLGEAKVSVGEDIAELRRGPKQDVDRYEKGELSYEGLLLREWQREVEQEGAIAVRLQHKQMSRTKAQTAIYHRVRRRLVRRGIAPPKPKVGWRSRLVL